MLTPKFLNWRSADLAVESVLRLVMENERLSHIPKRKMCHIIVLGPSMKDDRETNYKDWPNYQIEPIVLYDQSYGNRSLWTAKYDEIAKCKALQLWHDRNDGRTSVMPHLLFPGDTPYWGGVKREGIVVACSGLQPYLDRMIAGMTADMIIGYAYHQFATSEDVKEGVDFLT